MTRCTTYITSTTPESIVQVQEGVWVILILRTIMTKQESCIRSLCNGCLLNEDRCYRDIVNSSPRVSTEAPRRTSPSGENQSSLCWRWANVTIHHRHTIRAEIDYSQFISSSVADRHADSGEVNDWWRHCWHLFRVNALKRWAMNILLSSERFVAVGPAGRRHKYRAIISHKLDLDKKIIWNLVEYKHE